MPILVRLYCHRIAITISNTQKVAIDTPESNAIYNKDAAIEQPVKDLVVRLNKVTMLDKKRLHQSQGKDMA